MMFPNLDPKPIVQELRERLSEEVDYRIEAKNQTDFHRWYADHPFIHVPAVFARVLDRARPDDGAGDRRALRRSGETWSDEEKQLAAETIYRFVFRSLWSFHAFNGDPHPGNYLFNPGGRVTFLDFGLVKRFTQQDIDDAARMIEAHRVRGGRRRSTDAIVEEIGFLKADAPLTDAGSRGLLRLLLRDDPHGGGERLITHEYAAAMVSQYFDPTASRGAEVRQHRCPDFVILQRINLGLYAILARLEAKPTGSGSPKRSGRSPMVAPSTELGRQEAAWAARLKA